MSETTLRVLIVDQNLLRASILEEGLREAGYRDLIVVRDMQNLLRRIVDEEPDVILIDLENPNRDVLEQMFQVSRVVRKPVAMFVDRSDRSAIEAAIDAGVGAYVVGGLSKERVQSIIDMTISRFRAFDKLRTELDDTRRQLADRKVIDRAKGILMKQRGVSEDQAYELLRRTAMDANLKMAQVAQSVITAAELLK
jgi:response regulator NasT